MYKHCETLFSVEDIKRILNLVRDHCVRIKELFLGFYGPVERPLINQLRPLLEQLLTRFTDLKYVQIGDSFKASAALIG